MPTLNQLRQRVDDWLAARWPTVVERQDTYFGTHGHFWQGKRTHTFTPAHTDAEDGDTVADRLADKVHDQIESWLDLFPEFGGISIPATLWIDVYEGPSGPGFVASIEVTFNGTTYGRSQNHGPQDHRTKGWHIIEPELEP